LACIDECSFWRSQNDRQGASRAEIAVHRQVVEFGSSTRTTQSDNSQSRLKACAPAPHSVGQIESVACKDTHPKA